MPVPLRTRGHATRSRRAPAVAGAAQATARVRQLEAPTNSGPGRRRPWLALGSLLLVILCAVAGAELARRAEGRTSVLVLARRVAAGEPITAKDLTVAAVSAPNGVLVVPATSAPQVVGRQAATTLAAGALLVPSDLSVGPLLLPGTALVGASLAPDEMPAALAPGENVLCVIDAAPGSTGTVGSLPLASSQGEAVAGVVDSVRGQGAAAGAEVTVAVPEPRSSALARASAANELSLVEVPAKQTARP
jgi:hypothetical protein